MLRNYLSRKSFSRICQVECIEARIFYYIKYWFIWLLSLSPRHEAIFKKVQTNEVV